MLNEREVITLAFGNYSSLVAAQWANGTSHFDVHHNTLYTESRSSDVLGGSTSGGHHTRVPRLLLLDAPYSSVFDEVETWEEKYAEDEAADEQDDGYEQSNTPSSLLWGPSSGGGGSGGPASRHADPRVRSATTAATRRLDKAARAVQRHVWERHGLDDQDEDDDEDGAHSDDQRRHGGNEEDDDQSEESEEDDYAQLRRELGLSADWMHGNTTASSKSAQQSAHADEGNEDDAQAEPHQHNIPRQKCLERQRMAKLKGRLFHTHNTTIPWWQYITTGLAARSVTSLKPLQHIDAAGDIPALHSFGYGLAHLHSDKRAELSGFSDSLRSQLESADQLQGVQCFVDGDGLFGGAAANLLEQFWEEAGSKTPVVTTCTFTPLPRFITERDARSKVAFCERRMEEVKLNQLLATLHLSRHTSAVYIPVPLTQWTAFFQGTPTATSPTESPAWLQDERATAQYLAGIMDTALYGVRDGNNSSNTDRSSGSSTRKDSAEAPASLRAQGPLYYMDDWCRVVRPAPSLRVAAAMGALPQPVAQSAELWQFLEANPLLPDAPMLREDGRTAPPASAGGTPVFKTGFVPLTHAMSTYSPLLSAGQVLGHAVALRGAGCLPSTVYPTREAMLRYALPLRTSTYLPLLARSNYPISGTFPMELMFADPAKVEAQLPRGVGSLRDALQSVDVGAHVLSTYASAPMLRETVVQAQSVLRLKMDQYCAAYEMEKDDWREVLDEGLALHDDYHHAPPSDVEESDGGDDY